MTLFSNNSSRSVCIVGDKTISENNNEVVVFLGGLCNAKIYV